MDRSQLLTELVDEVFRVNAALLAEGDALAAGIGTTAAGWRVLGLLSDGAATVADIARRRGLRRQSVRETVERLERDGLVAREPNPADRRAPLVALTARGGAALRDIEPARADWAARRSADLDPADLVAALRLLRRLRAD
ncbi:Benzoate anaerobic degradation regulator (plasmid) [Tsukamurella tyrosinosolvens]|uniref:DNA-binding transcriptional regulator, MarR family n=1 Tax=Tsukamurella tyrosinosolvens TaxID=57704 RepID=A0A1H4YV46_TSUTY|nr:MarR family transcriptional regulator [Tsukamurella tyrosinosolvens]KXO90752.1 MarR family transcriptional regulator [Tsukamurella tyrosinosolvens]QRY84314.1 MarR family transcriptional regulator [Tsukamurella tyrosinosolvens]SED21693.1 DNA-binding transcriptional regulator, MarR family [Tsukamurella tyrosinosolvens]VEH91380.1 Benzoate anaerobic degradation regulator [Tsukamurella tyrosinosolvens]